MRPSGKLLVHVVWMALAISSVPGIALPVAAQQAGAPEKQGNAASNANQLLLANSGERLVTELPDSAGAIVSRSASSAQQQSGNSAPAASNSQATPTQPAQNQSQPPGQKPVGTAAAESPDTSGIAASQPAGVAIAPAKQRRVRTLVLRTGAIIGAGVAIGSVVALTAGTSSKPPGAR